MKKLAAVLITLVLAMSACIPAAYAKPYYSESNNSIQIDANVSYDLGTWTQMFKQYHKDKDKRKAILNKMIELKKKQHTLDDERKLVFVDGDELISDVPPVIKSGRTLIPVRALTTALGAEVKWNQGDNTVIIVKVDMKIEFKIGSDIVIVNGVNVKIDVPATIHNGRTVVPLRFIAELFGKTVEWDEETGSVIISDGDDNNTQNPVPVAVNDNTAGTLKNQFNFQGTWTYASQLGAYNNDIHLSNEVNAYYQVIFEGTQVKLYGAVDPAYGIAAISVDGAAETLIDCYNATRSDNLLLFTSPTLTSGQHTLKVRVRGTKNSSSTGTYINADRVEVISGTSTTPVPTPTTQNLALGKAATASSVYDNTMTADKAFDGKADTRWSSQFSDNEWLTVDLGSTQSVGKVKLTWETAYGKAYKIQVSTDGTNWVDAYSTTTGDGDTDEITFSPVNARYVKFLGVQKATNYGYSLWEFEIYSR